MDIHGQENSERPKELLTKLIKNNPDVSPKMWMAACLAIAISTFAAGGFDRKKTKKHINTIIDIYEPLFQATLKDLKNLSQKDLEEHKRNMER